MAYVRDGHHSAGHSGAGNIFGMHLEERGAPVVVTHAYRDGDPSVRKLPQERSRGLIVHPAAIQESQIAAYHNIPGKWIHAQNLRDGRPKPVKLVGFSASHMHVRHEHGKTRVVVASRPSEERLASAEGGRRSGERGKTKE